MNLWLRLIGVLIGSLFRPRLGLLDESVLPGRVWLTDLDLNIHMNNARYLAVMDLGRMDLFVRSGVLLGLIRCRIQPLVGSTVVRYRRALRPFQRFTLRTRALGWDDRRVYLEHLIEVRGVVACRALSSTAFKQAGQRISPAEAARVLGQDAASPPLPDWAQAWRDFEARMDEPKSDELAKAAE